jgi:Ni,Fe-hydrogenase III large subunit
VSVEQIVPDRWREAIAARLATGSQFVGGWATRHEDELTWHAAFTTSGGGTTVLACRADGGRAPTIVDLLPAADWDEREAHDLYGLGFDGHDPMRALAAHVEDPAAWTIPVEGEGVHEVAVGPIHAGVIESGHFRFHVVGERILAMDPRLFYKHRGLERAAEGRDVGGALRCVQRACAACAVANTLAYAQAAEEALGLWPDRALRASRTVLLELERLYNHLNDIGAVCAGVGFAPGAMAFAALKDRAQRINLSLTGHRFLFGTVAVGAGVPALSASAGEAARAVLRELRADAAAAWRELEFAGSLHARLDGIGVLGEADVVLAGACGPSARAAGVRVDVRQHSPRLAYEGFTPAAPREAAGDVAARLDIRAAELQATCEILDGLLAGPLPAGRAAAAHGPQPVGIGLVEGPRGATMAAVELDGGRVGRLHLRSGSYANWPALAHATAGNLLPDFPLINKSFELCYACVDR